MQLCLKRPESETYVNKSTNTGGMPAESNQRILQVHCGIGEPASEKYGLSLES